MALDPRQGLTGMSDAAVLALVRERNAHLDPTVRPDRASALSGALRVLKIET